MPDVEFLKAHTDRTVKVTVPGPFTMSQQAQNDHYPDPRSMALAYADAVNQEVLDLFAAGADIVQLDEPYMQARPEPAREYGLEALNRALDGATGTTAVHICFGYAAIIHDRPVGLLVPAGARRLPLRPGVHRDRPVEPRPVGARAPARQDDHPRRPRPVHSGRWSRRSVVAGRVRRALPFVEPDRVVLAPDCGMKYLPRASADGKMRSMVAAAGELRQEAAG